MCSDERFQSPQTLGHPSSITMKANSLNKQRGPGVRPGHFLQGIVDAFLAKNLLT